MDSQTSADHLAHQDVPPSANVTVQIATNDENIPSEQDFCRWVAAALPENRQDWELTVRIVSLGESEALNHQYRQKRKPTNVLSFAADLPPELNIPLLGDLAICAAIVEQEAQAQNKSLEAHWAHMTVHGTLHLLGYDHEDNAEALAMETLETRILETLQYPAPYE